MCSFRDYDRSLQGSVKKHADAVGAYNPNKAIMEADQASVQRYQALVSYEKVYVPFGGVITARNPYALCLRMRFR